jgi:hypothetical protein
MIGVDQVMADNDELGYVHPDATADNECCVHPGIVMRPGPTGPRAALVDGPDVWEVIAAVHALRGEGPCRHDENLRSELRTVTGLTAAQVAAALDLLHRPPRGR